MMAIFIEKGEPTRQGWKRLKVSMAEYFDPAKHEIEESEQPRDHLYFRFVPL